MKKEVLLMIFILIGLSVNAQKIDSAKSVEVGKDELKAAKEKGETIELERPFNFFASAGINHRLDNLYNVAISPIDNTVQFQKVSPLSSSISTGMVWNPFSAVYKVSIYKDKTVDYKYEVRRKSLAIALLVNIFALSFSSEQPKSAAPIDVGFGIGYRKENFTILLTSEFSALRQPRDYFINGYKDQNKTLILAGSQEPVRTLSTDDNSLFVSKLYPSIGLKIVYAFSKQKE